jgi:hypothetical protein
LVINISIAVVDIKLNPIVINIKNKIPIDFIIFDKVKFLGKSDSKFIIPKSIIKRTPINIAIRNKAVLRILTKYKKLQNPSGFTIVQHKCVRFIMIYKIE